MHSVDTSKKFFENEEVYPWNINPGSNLSLARLTIVSIWRTCPFAASSRVGESDLHGLHQGN